jgi:hypothetical protein
MCSYQERTFETFVLFLWQTSFSTEKVKRMIRRALGFASRNLLPTRTGWVKSILVAKTESWNITQTMKAETISNMEKDGALLWLSDPAKGNGAEEYNTLLAFLYLGSQAAQLKIGPIPLAKPLALLLMSKLDIPSGSFERLKQIAISGEKQENLPQGSRSFDTFVKAHPEWSSPSSFVLWRDHPKLKTKDHAYVERVQLSGLCAMHSGVVMQHILRTMENETPQPMIDLDISFAKHLRGEEFINHVWQNQGVNSVFFLRRLLAPFPVHTAYFEVGDEFVAKISTMMEQHGPGLISRFNVSSKFFDSSVWQHVGDKGEELIPEAFHSMLLVGFRTTEGGATRLLLQNWWKTKMFVEVDVAYLKFCGAEIHFVVKPQIGPFSSTFPLSGNFYNHVECSIDSPDRLDPLETV